MPLQIPVGAFLYQNVPTLCLLFVRILRGTSKKPGGTREVYFQDNKEDVAFLESGEGAQAIINLHVEGIFRYLQQ